MAQSLEQRLHLLEEQGDMVSGLTIALSNLLSVEDMPESIVRESVDVLNRYITDLLTNINELHISHVRAQRATRRLAAIQTRPPVPETIQTVPIQQTVQTGTIQTETVQTGPIQQTVQPRARIHVNRRPRTVAVISDRTTLRAMMPDACGICLDTNNRRKTITTSCGHHYCKGCFSHWAKNRRGAMAVSCPYCRENVVEITEYKGPPRQPRRQQSTVISESDSETEENNYIVPVIAETLLI
jgi:hypothetical protein